jgi:hypothetical protein
MSAPGHFYPLTHRRPWPNAPVIVQSAPPRASDQALAWFGSVCLKLFLAAQFLSLTRLFFANHVGGGIAEAASQAGLFSVVLLAPAALAYGARSGGLFGRLSTGGALWVGVVLTLALALFFRGWLAEGFVVTAAAHDLAPYLVVLAFTVIGSEPAAWRDLDRYLIVLFVAGLVVNGLGMTEMTQVVGEAYAEDRAGVTTVAYRTQGALAFWPLLLLTARGRRPLTMFLIFGGVLFVLAQQILFQKRAPTTRVLLFLLVFLVVLPLLAPHRRPAAGGERRVLALFALALALCVGTALTVTPWLFQGQLSGLASRMSGQAYAGGAAGMLTTENERFHEAAVFLRTVEPGDLAFGRGFGGYFKPDATWWGTWLDDVNEFGRRQLHVGGLMPFFKGGFALAIAYYAGVVLALGRGFRRRFEPRAAAAFFIVLLHVVFLAQEGWFMMSISFDLALVGLCLGHLLAAPAPRGLGAAA